MARDLMTRRVQRIPPRIDLAPFTITLLDGSEGRAQVIMPRGSPPDVRVHQALEIRLLDKEVVRLSYAEAVQYLDADIDPAYLYAFRQFVAAVDKAIPNDAHNLTHTVGNDTVSQTCHFSSPRILIDRLSAKSPWTSDELALLKFKWPDFDVEATILRATYWRFRKKRGVFADGPAFPDGMVPYATARNLPTTMPEEEAP